MAMDTSLIVLIIIAMLTIVGAFCMLIYVMRSTRRTDNWINHHVPLGDNARNARLEAALRDVDQGFNVCATCGVENAQYHIFCVLCGAPVEKLPDTNDKPPQERTTQQMTDITNTVRQRRARSRREWVRSQDGDGKFHWFHAGGHRMKNPAYVIGFRRKNSAISTNFVATTEEEIYIQINTEDDAIPQNPTNINDRAVFDGLFQVSAKLQQLFDAQEMDIALASVADPMMALICLRDGPSREATESLRMNDALAMTTLPFPARLASFVTHATSIQNTSGRLSLKIQRTQLLEESISLLAALPPNVVRSNIRLKFLGEEGIDAGGVYRQWFLLLNEAIVSPSVGVFCCVDHESQALSLNPHSREMIGEHHLASFLAVGRWLGRALLEGNVVGFHLAFPLLKIILGQPISLDDLEFYDRETHKNLKWLLENDGVDTLGLTFTFTERLPSRDTRTVELKPAGATIDVTDMNKHEFVDRKLKYLLFESISPQIFAFVRGIHEVVPLELLRLFDAEELDYMLAGSDEINVDDWEHYTKYTADLIDHPVREWFWDLVREMTHDQRCRLLQFSTGASRVPLAGFSALTSYDGRLCPFTLKGIKLKEEAHIRSHACFNTLDLPRYRDKEQLRLMLTSILLDDNQGFTIA